MENEERGDMCQGRVAKGNGVAVKESGNCVKVVISMLLGQRMKTYGD